MTIIQVSKQALHTINAKAFLFFVQEGGSIQEYQAFCTEWCPDIALLMKEKSFSGKANSHIVIPVAKNGNVIHIIFGGLGKLNEDKYIAVESYRRALAQGMRAAQRLKAYSIAYTLPNAQLFDISLKELAQETATIILMTGYHFNEYISDEERKKEHVQEVTICISDQESIIQEGIRTGTIIGQSVNAARRWVDLPPSALTPPHLADKARSIARAQNLEIQVFSEEEINKLGMGGLAGVSRGSEQDCQLVIMQYKTTKPQAPTIAFVGKGITFDSGGLSLKPPQFMETMKEDMSGAAVVIATMDAIAQLKPEINVIGVTPLAENLPSGTATKPGDIVRFYNGKTAEVKNTDAEGRLILADALAYTAEHFKPDAIIDIATLTGACAHALGPFFTGLMSQNESLTQRVERAAQETGDRVWRMPMDNDYAVAVKSPVADLCNIGSKKYMAGAITAAFFLKSFVHNIPWVHLDIAGTAFNVPDIPYYRPGATGVGVRLLINLAMHWK